MKGLGNMFGLSVVDLALLNMGWKDFHSLLKAVAPTEDYSLGSFSEEVKLSLECLDMNLRYKNYLDNPIVTEYNRQKKLLKAYNRDCRKYDSMGGNKPVYPIKGKVITEEEYEKAKEDGMNNYEIVIPPDVVVSDLDGNPVKLVFSYYERVIIKSLIESIQSNVMTVVKNINSEVESERVIFNRDLYTILLEKGKNKKFFYNSYLGALKIAVTNYSSLESAIIYLNERLQTSDGATPVDSEIVIFKNEGTYKIENTDALDSEVSRVFFKDREEGFPVLKTLVSSKLISYLEENGKEVRNNKLDLTAYANVYNIYDKLNGYLNFDLIKQQYNIPDLTKDYLDNTLTGYKRFHSGELSKDGRRYQVALEGIKASLAIDNVDVSLLDRYLDGELTHEEVFSLLGTESFKPEDLDSLVTKLSLLGFGLLDKKKHLLFLDSFKNYYYTVNASIENTKEVVECINLVTQHYMSTILPIGGLIDEA